MCIRDRCKLISTQNKTFFQVRQVEYKDKLDEEWEMFQRAIKEENHVSNQNNMCSLSEGKVCDTVQFSLFIFW